jgi:hypothetical protein
VVVSVRVRVCVPLNVAVTVITVRALYGAVAGMLSLTTMHTMSPALTAIVALGAHTGPFRIDAAE